MSDVFLALADTTRREILRIVSRQPRSAGDIALAFKQKRPAISKHLTVLKEAGLISERRDRQRRVYSFNCTGVLPLRTFLGVLGTGTPAGETRESGIPERADGASVLRVAAMSRELGPSGFGSVKATPSAVAPNVVIAPSSHPPVTATPSQQFAADPERRSQRPGQWDMDFD